MPVLLATLARTRLYVMFVAAKHVVAALIFLPPKTRIAVVLQKGHTNLGTQKHDVRVGSVFLHALWMLEPYFRQCMQAQTEQGDTRRHVCKQLPPVSSLVCSHEVCYDDSA